MKIENTIKNKTRFFALYWGQNLWFKKDWADFNSDNSIQIEGDFLNTIDENDCIFLKPLSEITDEDALQLGKLVLKEGGITISNTANNVWIETLKSYIQIDKLKQIYIVYDADAKKEEDDFNTNLLVVDYLRSKGYVIPFMNLSVVDLIEYGWIKLK